MITRRKVRRVALHVGVALGALSLVAFIVSVVTPLGGAYALGARSFILARGSVAFYWQGSSFVSYSSFPNGDPGAGSWRVLPKWVDLEGSFPSGFGHSGEFILPLWIPTAIGLLCAYFLLPERGPRHLCAKCNYDLSAVPPKNGRTTCPECGTIAEM